MHIRLAEVKDIDQLIRMRWDFTIEDDEGKRDSSYSAFAKECRTFYQRALENGMWYIWVAEEDGRLVSHIYIELIEKVPRPGRITRPFAYMTNVYTLPEWRSQGVGSALLRNVNQWIADNQYEFAIVWPSEKAVRFYEKNGYMRCTEPMEYFPDV